MKNGFEDFQFDNCVTRYTQNFPIFPPFSFAFSRKESRLPFLHPVC